MKRISKFLILLISISACKKNNDIIIPETNPETEDNISPKSIIGTTWKIDSIKNNGRLTIPDGYIYFASNWETFSGKIINNKIHESRIHKFSEYHDSTYSINERSVYFGGNSNIEIPAFYTKNTLSFQFELFEVYLSKVDLDLSALELEIEFEFNTEFNNRVWRDEEMKNFVSFNDNIKINFLRRNDYYFNTSYELYDYTVRANNNIIITKGSNNNIITDTITIFNRDQNIYLYQYGKTLPPFSLSQYSWQDLNLYELDFSTDLDITQYTWIFEGIYNINNHYMGSNPEHTIKINNGKLIKTYLPIESSESWDIIINENIISNTDVIFGEGESVMWKYDPIGGALYLRFDNGNYLKYYMHY